MASVTETAKAAHHNHIISAAKESSPLPWQTFDVVRSGVPRSGATRRVYTGSGAFGLWIQQSLAGQTCSQWFTSKAAARCGGHPRSGAVPSPVRGAVVFNREDLEGLDIAASPQWPDAASGCRRAKDLVSFIGVTVKKGKGGWIAGTDVIRLEPESSWPSPSDYWATVLHHLIRWTGQERHLGRDLDPGDEQLLAELASAWFASHLQLHAQVPCDPSQWIERVTSQHSLFWSVANDAWRAIQYLLDLTHPALLEELESSAIHGNATAAEGAGLSADLVTSLGQILIVSDEEMADDDNTISRTGEQPLILAHEAGTTLREFLAHFLGTSDWGNRRSNPPLSAWIAGGPGTGRNQIISALHALFRTGGTDVTGTLVATEDGGGTLLEAIEGVWSDENLEVLPCELPSRIRVRHDRAIPTACLQAFHVSRGLSPILWVARLEHRLIRSGEYEAFIEAFDARTQNPWRGTANRQPERHLEDMIAALGGAAKGARRRVTHYQRTRASSGWDAFFDEVEYAIHNPYRPHPTPTSARPKRQPSQRRILFSVDLASALQSSDPAAQGWLRRCLSSVPSRMEDMSRPDRRPFWFLFSPDTTLKELDEIVRWKPKVRKQIKIHVDLDQHPVTAAFNHRLLAKLPGFSRPIYRLYAKDRRAIGRLSNLDGWRIPNRSSREQTLSTFPFLPPVLPVAQAILDTLASDGADREASPLAQLIKRAIDEHFFAPPDRFIPLDVLLEPILPLLETASKPQAAIRIFIPAKQPTADWRPAFTHEAILTTLRLVNRVRDFPSTPDNLLRLMFVRFDRPFDVLQTEVQETLDELVSRGFAKRTAGTTTYQWIRNI